MVGTAHLKCAGDYTPWGFESPRSYVQRTVIVDIYSHLRARHMDINLHRPIVDTEKCVATYLLYNLSGQIVGYQQYNPNGQKGVFNSKEHGKYYTYRKSPTVTVWGLS